jgi:uncharacterized protein YigA (DUF484 family)
MTATAAGHRATAKVYAGKAEELRRQAAEYDEVVKHHTELAEKLEGASSLGHLTSAVRRLSFTQFQGKTTEAAVMLSQGSSGESWEVYVDHHYIETSLSRTQAELIALKLLEEKEAEK